MITSSVCVCAYILCYAWMYVVAILLSAPLPLLLLLLLSFSHIDTVDVVSGMLFSSSFVCSHRIKHTTETQTDTATAAAAHCWLEHDSPNRLNPPNFVNEAHKIDEQNNKQTNISFYILKYMVRKTFTRRIRWWSTWGSNININTNIFYGNDNDNDRSKVWMFRLRWYKLRCDAMECAWVLNEMDILGDNTLDPNTTISLSCFHFLV